jgi:hypothetical protein
MASSVMANRVRLRRYRNIFQKAHATIPERAIHLGDYGILRDKMFNRLLNRKIIIGIGNVRFYYDLMREKYLVRKGSLQVVFILAVIIVITFIIFLWKTP